jgi:hypothetical protein
MATTAGIMVMASAIKEANLRSQRAGREKVSGRSDDAQVIRPRTKNWIAFLV